MSDAGGPYVITQGEALVLDGSDSSDPDEYCGDTIVTYEWDIDGDGQYNDAFGAQPTVPWGPLLENLPLNTQVHIGLRVRDSMGFSGADTAGVTIYQAAPTPCFSLLPEQLACGGELAVDAGCSVHPDPRRSIDLYEWQWDSPLPYEDEDPAEFTFTADETGETALHGYDVIGEYRITLRITDDMGNMAIVQHSVTMTPQEPPVAVAGGPYVINEGDALLPDGGGSFDPEASCGDSIVTYEWDINGDGQFDNAFGATPVISYAALMAMGDGAFVAADPDTHLPAYTVRLRVRDTVGLTGIAASAFVILPVCGNGIVSGPEQCDDGNEGSGDGCSDGCVIEPGYTCPTANAPCLDIDECLEGTDTCPQHATCGNTVGSYTCTCNEGWTGDLCDACAAGRFGESCTSCPACVNGSCNEGLAGDGLCACNEGWTGDLCDACVAGRFGESCSVCPACVNGSCNEGLAGDGLCACNEGWTGDLCDACAAGRFGESCTSCPACVNGSCNEGLAGDGLCACNEGWTGDLCDACVAGRFGESCSVCPACVNGSCNEGLAGDGLCACTEGWTGDLCDACTAGYFGESCTSCPACVNGSCNEGLAGDGLCACNEGWTGELCDACAAGRFGDICSVCPVCVNGVCNDGTGGDGLCLCNQGWEGELCDVPVCTTACDANATCIEPDTCQCNEGYSGDGYACEEITECSDQPDWTPCGLGACFSEVCEALGENDTCETALPLAVDQQITGDLQGFHAYRAVEDACLADGLTGHDAFYAVTLEPAYTYRVTLTPAADTDMVLVALSGCDDQSQCLDAADDATAGGAEELVVSGDGEVIIQVIPRGDVGGTAFGVLLETFESADGDDADIVDDDIDPDINDTVDDIEEEAEQDAEVSDTADDDADMEEPEADDADMVDDEIADVVDDPSEFIEEPSDGDIDIDTVDAVDSVEEDKPVDGDDDVPDFEVITDGDEDSVTEAETDIPINPLKDNTDGCGNGCSNTGGFGWALGLLAYGLLRLQHRRRRAAD